MALVRAYEGWKDAEREGSAYDYCWRNFLSAQTLQAIHSLRKQFNFILKDAGLLDADSSTSNSLSHNQSLVRAIICSGLFPGITSVVVNDFLTLSFQIFSIHARYACCSPDPYIIIYVCSTGRSPCPSKQWMMVKFYFML